jgi:hypothetical protein
MGTHEPSRTIRTLIASVLFLVSFARGEEPPGPTPDADAPLPPKSAAEAVGEATGEKEGEPSASGETKEGFSIPWPIPIPEVILDPNEGDTFGLMAVWLLTDEKDEIKYMIAPDVRWNETKGTFPSFRLFGFPTSTRRYSVALGKSTTRDEDYEVEFAERGLLEEKAFILAKFLYERDSTERFYGFGNDTDEDEESNYTGEDLYADVQPGYWILPKVNVSYRMRIRRYNVQPGQVAAVGFIGDVHPEVRGKGLESGVYWQHRLAVAYDTRDSIDMPMEGMLLSAYVDGADRHLGSHTSFVAYGFEWRNFLPFRGEKHNPILATRAFIDYLQGGTDTPFYLRNSLGGRRALRGYGSDRFTDFNRSLVSAELRTRVYQRKIFGVNGELELAPFIEAGQVFRHIYDSPVDDLHVIGGLGIRALVRPRSSPSSTSATAPRVIRSLRGSTIPLIRPELRFEIEANVGVTVGGTRERGLSRPAKPALQGGAARWDRAFALSSCAAGRHGASQVRATWGHRSRRLLCMRRADTGWRPGQRFPTAGTTRRRVSGCRHPCRQRVCASRHAGAYVRPHHARSSGVPANGGVPATRHLAHGSVALTVPFAQPRAETAGHGACVVQRVMNTHRTNLACRNATANRIPRARNAFTLRLTVALAVVAGLGCAAGPLVGLPREAIAQEPASPSDEFSTQSAAPPAAELQQLVAPIALYPDAARRPDTRCATYPEQIVEAARWLHRTAGSRTAARRRSGQATVGSERQSADGISGGARQHGQEPLVDVVARRRLRQLRAGRDERHPGHARRAQAAGHLKTTSQEKVTEDAQTIAIEPTNPEVVYVPQYDPWGVCTGAPHRRLAGMYCIQCCSRTGIAWARVSTSASSWFGWGSTIGGADWNRHSILFTNVFVSRGRTS